MKTSDRWVLAQWILVGLLGLSLLTARSAYLAWARFPGALLAAFGALVVGLSAYSYRQVNRSLFHVSPDPDRSGRLVESGIYSRVRHPVYTGVIAGSFGLALFHGSVWSLISAAILALFYYLKSHYEETLLNKAFSGYAAYRQRTGRLFPPLRTR